MPQTPTYPNWKAPSEDGGVLVWPGGSELLRQTSENQRHLPDVSSILIQNLPLSELRQRARAWLGHHDDARAIIATGHQTELYHPGVWVKNVVIDELARKLDGQALLLAIDTDEPKHLQLRWPNGIEPITDDWRAGSAAWCGLVAGPTPAHLNKLEKQLSGFEQRWGYSPLAVQLLGSMRRLSVEQPGLPDMLVKAMHELDWGLGLRHQAVLAAPVWSSEPYLLFVHHLLAHAGHFAQQYNQALAEFRAQQAIRIPGRPMPDLRITPDTCEAAFWTDDLSGVTRTRTTLIRRVDGFALVMGADELLLDQRADGWAAAARLADWLGQHRLRLAPRALTLTMFLRLCVADQWIHGVGGARYDQVLDRLIQQHFGLRPPHFAVATATLIFPGAVGRQKVCIPCIHQQGHRLRHSLLGEEKMKLVEEIESLPRGSAQRAGVFQEMHRRLDSVVQNAPRMKVWEQQAREAEKQAGDDQVLFDRELFYAFQSRQRLEGLIERCRSEML